MGLDNPLHLLFLLLILLLVFGAKRLPEMGRSLGSGLRGFKESISAEPSHAQVEKLTADAEVPAGAAPGAVAVAEQADHHAPARHAPDRPAA